MRDAELVAAEREHAVAIDVLARGAVVDLDIVQRLTLDELRGAEVGAPLRRVGPAQCEGFGHQRPPGLFGRRPVAHVDLGRDRADACQQFIDLTLVLEGAGHRDEDVRPLAQPAAGRRLPLLRGLAAPGLHRRRCAWFGVGRCGHPFAGQPRPVVARACRCAEQQQRGHEDKNERARWGHHRLRCVSAILAPAAGSRMLQRTSDRRKPAAHATIRYSRSTPPCEETRCSRTT